MRTVKPNKAQLERRNSVFKFSSRKMKSWFYLGEGQLKCSFHQETTIGQQNVHGLTVKRLVAALIACGYIALVLCLPIIAEAKAIEPMQGGKDKKVIIPYNDFLTMVSAVEHKEKLLKQCASEREILVKLNDENGTIKRLNAQQVEALSDEIKEHEKLGETQEQIIQVAERQLSGITGALVREKRLSRYKSEAFWLGVLAVGLWVVN